MKSTVARRPAPAATGAPRASGAPPLPPDGVETHPGLLVHDIARLMRRIINAEGKAQGLSLAQWRTLMHLSRREGCRQAELAEVLEIAPITLGRLIDRMEKAALLERRPNPQDRRAVQLYLRPKARTMVERLWAYAGKVLVQSMHGMSAAQQRQLGDALGLLRTNLLAMAPAARGKAVVRKRVAR